MLWLASDGIRPPGDADVVAVLYNISFPFIVYSFWTSILQRCSQVGHCELFSYAEKKKRKRNTVQHLKSSWGLKAKYYRLCPKDKKPQIWNSYGAGNSQVKGQRGTSFPKKEWEVKWVYGRLIISCLCLLLLLLFFSIFPAAFLLPQILN